MPKAILINPGTKQSVGQLRVAAYCRVSTNSADQLNSYAAQIRYYTGYINRRNDWTLVGIFADEGISGTSADKRPEFQRLITASEHKQVDLIITKSVSRFCRNTKESLEYVRKLKLLGVGVQFEKEGINTLFLGDEMLLNTFSAIAQEESVSISQNLRMANAKRMADGSFIDGNAPYGFRMKERKLVPYEPEATVVKRIFALYLDGCSFREIAQILEAEGIESKQGNKHWEIACVKYILSNEKYIGDSLFQKTFTTPTLPFTQKRNRGHEDQYYVERTHEGIVSRETFDSVQSLINKRRKKAVGVQPEAAYILSRKMHCSECGAFFTRRHNNGCISWGCSNHVADKNACTSNYYREERIYDGFIGMVNKLKFGNTDIIGGVIRQLEAAVNLQKKANASAMQMSVEVHELTAKLLMLEQLRAKGYLAPEVYQTQMREINAEITKKNESRRQMLESKLEGVLDEVRTLKARLDELEEPLEAFHEQLFKEIVKDIHINNRDEMTVTLMGGLTFTEQI